MIIVRVELHSAITGEVSEIARMHIANDGEGTARSGNYIGRALRGRSKEALDKRLVQRTGNLKDYPRLSIHVWHLVSRMLQAMGYK